jgi:phosphoglycolate phosphatase
MLTNKPVAPAQKILKKFGLENSFATYLCGDTTPERKPSPAGINEILRQTGIAPEKAIMIGDDTPDVLAAKNAGIDCITLLEGFGKAENLLPLEPRYTAGHIKDFAEFIN